MRNLASFWLDSSNSEKDWYIGTKKDEIDARLERFIPPSNVIRLPRTIYSRRHWKFYAWRKFLLFYGPLVLKRVLPEKYFNHFMLFSESVYLLSQSKISQMEIFEARQKIILFVKQFQTLYGLEHMTFNLHKFLHACDCVANIGPFWAYSTYGFEDSNGKIQRMFNGNQCIAIQIVKRYKQLQVLNALMMYLGDSDQPFETMACLEIQTNILGSFVPTKKLLKVGNVTLMGSGPMYSLSEEEISLTAYLNLTADGRIFQRFVYNKQLFTVNSYKVNANRQNSIILRNDGNLYKIKSCYLLNNQMGENVAVILGRLLHARVVTSNDRKKQLMLITNQGALVSFKPSSIVSKCVLINLEQTYVAVLPNLFDRD